MLGKCGSWLFTWLILGGRTGGINGGLGDDDSELFRPLTGRSKKFLGFLWRGGFVRAVLVRPLSGGLGLGVPGLLRMDGCPRGGVLTAAVSACLCARVTVLIAQSMASGGASVFYW